MGVFLKVNMKILLAAAIVVHALLPSRAFADSGMALRLTVTEKSAEGTFSITTGVLMKLNEYTSFDVPSHYGIGIQSREEADGRVNLVVSVKDLSGESPVYGGAGTTSLAVGENVLLPLKGIETAVAHYEVRIESSYAELPQ